jgi:hypothetical protein
MWLQIKAKFPPWFTETQDRKKLSGVEVELHEFLTSALDRGVYGGVIIINLLPTLTQLRIINLSLQALCL